MKVDLALPSDADLVQVIARVTLHLNQRTHLLNTLKRIAEQPDPRDQVDAVDRYQYARTLAQRAVDMAEGQ